MLKCTCVSTHVPKYSIQYCGENDAILNNNWKLYAFPLFDRYRLQNISWKLVSSWANDNNIITFNGEKAKTIYRWKQIFNTLLCNLTYNIIENCSILRVTRMTFSPKEQLIENIERTYIRDISIID